MPIRLVIDYPAMERMLERNSLIILTELGHRVEAIAKQLAPVRTGLLRDSIETRVEILGAFPVVFVGSDLEYADWVEHGTGVYRTGAAIYPQQGEFLVFTAQDGTIVFARSVLGQVGQHFLERAFLAVFR